MSFLARLATDLITVEAGATTPMSIELINRGEADDQFELSIEGLDPEWTAVPVPVVTIKEKETQEEKIFFKPPRVSESSAGNYPFVLRVRSLTSGEARTVQGVLTVKPFHHLSVEISPKKGYVSPVSKHNTFEATLINLGNTEHTLQLFGNDPEDACAFEFDAEQVALGPGQQKTVLVTVTPSKRSIISGSRLYGFGVSARSIEQPSVVAIAQAQLEQKPLMSIGTLAAAILVLLVAGLWVYLIPPKPTLKLTVASHDMTKGDAIHVSWASAGSPESVHIVAMGQSVYDGQDLNGAQDFIPAFKPDEPTTSFDVTGYVEKDGRKYIANTVHIVVKEPPHFDDPKIASFKLDQTNVALGSTITVTYKVSNAVKAVLLPMGTSLDLSVDQTQIQANDVNTRAYTLVAYNQAGKMDRKSISVKIFVPSKAKVLSFTANPAEIDGQAGDVVLSWQVTNAARIELDTDGEVRTVAPTDNLTIHVTKTTVVTLTAYDDAGIIDRKAIKVAVVPPPDLPDQNGPPPGEGPPPTSIGTTGP